MSRNLAPVEVTEMGRANENGVSGGVYKPRQDMEMSFTNGQLSDSPPPAYTAVDGIPENGKIHKSSEAAQVHGGSTNKVGDDKTSEKGDGKPEKPEVVGIGEMFRFADCKDRFLIIFGIIMSCLNGAARPSVLIIFGNMTDMFIDDSILNQILDMIVANITSINPNTTITRDFLRENTTVLFQILDSLNMSDSKEAVERVLEDTLFNQMREYSAYYAIMGAAIMIVAYAQVACFQTAAYNQSLRIRLGLFRAILKQEIGWFDTHESGELNTRLSDDVDKIETGIGDKLSQFFQQVCVFIAGIIIGFVYGWKLTLVILSVSPLLAAGGAVMAHLGAKLTTMELKAYAKAGAVAEEVLGAIRTVMAFGGQKKEIERYSEHLVDARDFGIRKGTINGLSMGVVFCVMFCSYGLAFWYGSKLTREEPDNYTPGKVLVIFFSVLIGTFSVGSAGPNIQDFANARGAAFAIYGIIDQKPSIDSSSTKGKKPKGIQGNLEFRNVFFKYPSRPDVPILNGFNLKVAVGQTVALVGSSGCGKSTSVALLQRFYDTLEGQVLLDGVDIRELNVAWLRQQIGVVSQEPILFATTIKENISYGRDGVSQDEIERACKEANAHNFIMKLPKKYETMVGERGAQLSGGQKQRIAIARALVSDPKVLLLDEATSALDTESEATVQAALDQVSQSRTTIIIAHRLSTVRNADVIAGLSDGVVAEQGSHDELMKHEGIYYTLCTNQTNLGEEFTDLGLEGKKRTRQISEQKGSFKLKRMTSTTSAGDEQGLTTQVSVAPNEEEEVPEASMKRIMRMNAPETCMIILGCIGSVIMGGIQPAFAVIFSEIIGSFSNLDPAEQESKANMFSGLFCAIGAVAGLSMFTMSFCFAKSGEYLTMRMRQTTFKALLRQEVSYFDDSRNTTGALCARLATDASAVQGATGSRLATVFQSIAAIAAALGIGFAYCWELTLLILAFAPFLVGASFVQMRKFSGKNNRKSTEEAGKVAIEAIENIRTVAQLTKEEKFFSDYEAAVAIPYQQNRKKVHVQAVAYAISQAVMYFANAGCYTLGAYLVQIGRIDFTAMFRVFSAIVFSAMSVGQATSFAPDYGKAKLAAAKIFQLIDKIPSIDTQSEEGSKMKEVNGSVQLRDVKFTYPTRATVPVLKGVDIDVNPGQVVALVGSSGCGKSTIIQLLERFYDPAAGTVSLDGQRVAELNLGWFRNQVGIVSQEPILFDCSIRDNIAYGDNSRQVGMDEIITAAKNANIHNFIESLPLGYDTNVGDKGAQLSGGQKQRVAIARALVRDPKILLLDEATSALDTESEKVVQEALDRAQEGRTSIVIAHRLSTIHHADRIYVLQNGQVAEFGTHSELIAKESIYYRLNTAQLKRT